MSPAPCRSSSNQSSATFGNCLLLNAMLVVVVDFVADFGFGDAGDSARG